jgi:hypothetical protein
MPTIAGQQNVAKVISVQFGLHVPYTLQIKRVQEIQQKLDPNQRKG